MSLTVSRGKTFFQSISLRSAGVCHKILRISKEMFVLEMKEQDIVLSGQ